jgi:hypothetical protein
MTRLASLLGRAVLLGLVWLIVTHPTITLVNGFVECWRFPVVLPLAALGAFIQTLTLTPARRILLTTPCLVGIAAAIAGAKVEIPGLPWAAHDFTAKAEFWIPVSLCFPAAAGLAWLSRWSLRILTLVLVAFLVIPWAPRAAAKLNYGECAKTTIRDPNYNSIAWAEAIGQYLAIAKVGYWNPRWAQYPAERALYDLLRLEVEAGRVTADTHIVHVAPIVYLFQDTILFSVFVGINGDLYMANYMPDKSIVGGRVRPIEMAPDVIAKRPRYVVVHEKTHSGHALTPEVLESLPLEGYEEMM